MILDQPLTMHPNLVTVVIHVFGTLRINVGLGTLNAPAPILCTTILAGSVVSDAARGIA